MRRQKLLNYLEKSREVTEACINTLLTERVNQEEIEAGLQLTQQWLDAAKEMLNKTDDTIYREDNEELYRRAVKLVTTEQKASTAMLQRHLRIGYGRAALLIDMMVEREVITPASSRNRRHKVLPPAE